VRRVYRSASAKFKENPGNFADFLETMTDSADREVVCPVRGSGPSAPTSRRRPAAG
jgi:hypothetical protein